MTTLEQDLITELGLDDLPEETQAELLTQMTQSVLKRIALAVLERLSEDERAQFEEVQNEQDPEKMEAFLREHIDDYDALVNDTVKEFKEEIRTTIDQLKEALATQ